MSISPRIARAGLVVADPASLAIRRVITLQYNPDSVTRSISPRAAGGDTGPGGETLRLTGPPNQTISFDAELDATDQLEHPSLHPAEAEHGVHPYLAVLETLLYPSYDELTDNARLADAGVIEILPIGSPLLILVWSARRVVPVRLTELSVVEEAFDVRLNPIRAKVSLSCKVLTVSELGLRTRSGALAHDHHARLLRLAAARGYGELADFGVGVPLP